MEFTVSKEDLLKPLQGLLGVVEKRKTLPVLSNILVKIEHGEAFLCATDLDVEVGVHIPIEGAIEDSEITLPARKLTEICRALPDGSILRFVQNEHRMQIVSGKSRFSLMTLPARDFPRMEHPTDLLRFSLPQKDFRFLLEKTHFAMAHSDVRYFLNGVLLEFSQQKLTSVATDGHRLSKGELEVPTLESAHLKQIIVTRKGVLELLRLLGDSDGQVDIGVNAGHLHVNFGHVHFVSKLIEGSFPDYRSVVPRDGDKVIEVDREAFRQMLLRASILSNEKYRGVRLQLRVGVLRAVANNPDQEEAEDELEIEYRGGDLDIGFNVNYLIEVMSAIDAPTVRMTLSHPNGSVLIESTEDTRCVYIVMPMRI